MDGEPHWIRHAWFHFKTLSELSISLLMPSKSLREGNVLLSRIVMQRESDARCERDTDSPEFPCCWAMASGAVQWRSASREAMKSGMGHSSPEKKPRVCRYSVWELYLQDGHCLGEMMLFHGGCGVQCCQRVVKLLQVAVAVASVVQVMTQAGYKQTFPLGTNRETGEDNMRLHARNIFF